MLRQPKLAAYITSIRAYPEGLAFSARVEQALDDGALRSTEPRVMVEFPDGRSCGNDDPNRLHRDDLSWLHFATLSEGAQLVLPSGDGGRPAPIAEYSLASAFRGFTPSELGGSTKVAIL